MKDFHKSDCFKNGVFTVELVDDNIYKWQVKLFVTDQENLPRGDLQILKENDRQKHVLLEIRLDRPLDQVFS